MSSAPRVIHRYWEGDPGPAHTWVTAVVRDAHPGAEVVDWDEGGVSDIDIDESQVRPVDIVRHRSNIIRYTLLHRHGGMWLDYDLVPFADLFAAVGRGAWTAALYGRREGSALCFTPGHPMLGEMLSAIKRAPPSERVSADVSGANLLERVGIRHLDVSKEHRLIPVDGKGCVTREARPLAIHLWDTTRVRWLGP